MNMLAVYEVRGFVEDGCSVGLEIVKQVQLV